MAVAISVAIPVLIASAALIARPIELAALVLRLLAVRAMLAFRLPQLLFGFLDALLASIIAVPGLGRGKGEQ
ncbi:MAG: hypothetical protein ACR2IF_10130 [Terriglobales bacterium]